MAFKPVKSLVRARARAAGYRSGLEEVTAKDLAQRGVKSDYESVKVTYLEPATVRTYTPDFPLPNGILIETKGRFTSADRQKHKHIKKTHPNLDVRFVFNNPDARLTKTSKTTYGKWCESYGFLYSRKTVPQEWLDEPPCSKRIAALAAARK